MKKEVRFYFVAAMAGCLSVLCVSFAYAQTCEVDGPDGRWVDITQYVPPGECFDAVYTGILRQYSTSTGGLRTWYFFTGKSDRYKIQIPIATTGACRDDANWECNCNNYHNTGISHDAYNDCLGVSERCYGVDCNGAYNTVYPPGCTECLYINCWYIINDIPNTVQRRSVYEWVCNTCAAAYNEKTIECGGANNIKTWNNETCKGECNFSEQNLGPMCQGDY